MLLSSHLHGCACAPRGALVRHSREGVPLELFQCPIDRELAIAQGQHKACCSGGCRVQRPLLLHARLGTGHGLPDGCVSADAQLSLHCLQRGQVTIKCMPVLGLMTVWQTSV